VKRDAEHATRVNGVTLFHLLQRVPAVDVIKRLFFFVTDAAVEKATMFVPAKVPSLIFAS